MTGNNRELTPQQIQTIVEFFTSLTGQEILEFLIQNEQVYLPDNLFETARSQQQPEIAARIERLEAFLSTISPEGITNPGDVNQAIDESIALAHDGSLIDLETFEIAQELLDPKHPDLSRFMLYKEAFKAYCNSQLPIEIGQLVGLVRTQALVRNITLPSAEETILTIPDLLHPGETYEISLATIHNRMKEALQLPSS